MRSSPSNAALIARLAVAAVAGALYEACSVGLTATATWLICRAAQQPPLAALVVATVLVRALAIGRGAFRYAERLAGHDAVLTLMARLRGRFFEALVPLAPSGLTEFRRAELLARLASDVEAVEDLLIRAVLPAFAVFMVGGASVVWAFTLLPQAGLALALGLLVAGLVLPVGSALMMYRTGVRLSAAKEELAAGTVDLVEGVEDLLLNGAYEGASQQGWAVADAVVRIERIRAGWQAVLSAVGVLVQLGTCAAVGWFALTSRLDPVMVAVLVLASLAVLEVALPLHAAGERWGALVTSLRRVRTVLALRVADDPQEPVRAPETPTTVSLIDVSVIYPGAAAPSLSGVSLSVPAGARVALVGPSGSGKSTVLALVLRLVRPGTGRVELSGTDINALAGADLRPRLVAGLTQDAALFSGSIRSNLLLADSDATDARMWAVLARAGAEPWVRQLPDGLDTWIGRQGGRLSGGERQRLALAVALLSDPSVLVLDEPTESLDPAAADAVLADTVHATAGRTVLLVSHRLHGLEDLDKIVVLDGGRVVQCGAHKDLISQPGYYQERYRAEVGGAASNLVTFASAAVK
jgi:thiol reductant ABC exporter CydC subunit